jgi:hypothetical protein
LIFKLYSLYFIFDDVVASNLNLFNNSIELVHSNTMKNDIIIFNRYRNIFMKSIIFFTWINIISSKVRIFNFVLKILSCNSSILFRINFNRFF